MTAFYRFVKPFAKPGWITFGFILVALFNLVFFPGFSKYFGISTDLNDVLDLKLHYTPDIVYDIMNRLGEKGRKVYRASEIFVDFPYLIVYTVLYTAVIIRLTKLLHIQKNYLIRIPLLLGVFDVLENLGIIILLSNYPERINNLVKLTSVFTSLKWLFALLTILSILFLAVKWVLSRFKK